MKSLKDIRLLVITDRYPHERDSISSSFVKDQVDCLKDYVERIDVIGLIPYVPKYLSGSSFMNPRWKRDAFANDYEYDNVSVYFARYFNLPIDLFRSKKGDAAFKAAYKMVANQKIDFDLIHAHFTYPSGYVAVKLKEIYNRPAVLTVHEGREWFLKEINDRNAVYVWNNINKIIRVNKKDLKDFSKIGINEDKLMYLPNGFAADRFRCMNPNTARKVLGLPLDYKILLNIGHLEEYKGQKYLIESMKTILAARQDVMLYIVGQGSLKPELQSLINRYDLQSRVILAGGNKPADEIPLWMNACDVFVLPSISESFGIVQIEAMACGKPVVATRNGGSEDIVINDKLGILVEPRDPEGLARAILQALETEWNAEYIREYAQQFTWERIAEKIVRVYCEVLGSH